MITEKAMLAAVHISIWTAVKHDRKVSRDVADQHGAHQGAGRYNKQLLRGADKLDELRTLAGQIRQHFYKITLPWSDEGFRLLPANFYFDLMARMREFEAGFEQGVECFLGVYPQYIEQVRPELNGLFKVTSVRHSYSKSRGYLTLVGFSGQGGAKQAKSALGQLAGAVAGALGL